MTGVLTNAGMQVQSAECSLEDGMLIMAVIGVLSSKKHAVFSARCSVEHHRQSSKQNAV